MFKLSHDQKPPETEICIAKEYIAREHNIMY